MTTAIWDTEAGIIDCQDYSIIRQANGQWHAVIKQWGKDMGMFARWDAAYVAIREEYGDSWWD